MPEKRTRSGKKSRKSRSKSDKTKKFAMASKIASKKYRADPRLNYQVQVRKELAILNRK